MSDVIDIVAKLKVQGLSAASKQINDALTNKRVGVDVAVSSGAKADITSLTDVLTKLNATLLSTRASSTSATNNFNNIARGARQAASGMQTIDTSGRAVAATMRYVDRSTRDVTDAINLFSFHTGIAVRRFAAFSLGAGALIRLSQSFREGISKGVEFQHQMVRISQVSGDSANVLRALGREISNISTKLGVTSDDLTKAALTFKQAGLSIKDTEIALEAMAKAALAPNFDSMSETAEGAIAIMAQFKTGAAGLEAALGSMNAVAGEFAVEAADLITLIQKSGGAFKAAGGDLNELLGLFTAVRATTRESADQIATGLRTIFGRLQRNDVVEGLKAMQIQLRYTADEARELGDPKLVNQFVGVFEAFRRISTAMSDIPTSDPKFAQITELIGGSRQLSRVIPSIQEFATAQKAAQVAQAGTISLDLAAQKSQESLQIQLTKTKEKFLELFRSITNDKSFDVIVRGVLAATDGLIALTSALKPILPLLAAVSAVKITGSFTGGAARYLSRGIIHGIGFRYASGGQVPGSGNDDTVPILATPGEYIFDRVAVQRIGVDRLKDLHERGREGRVPARRYASGGSVGNIIHPSFAGVSDLEAHPISNFNDPAFSHLHAEADAFRKDLSAAGQSVATFTKYLIQFTENGPAFAGFVAPEQEQPTQATPKARKRRQSLASASLTMEEAISQFNAGDAIAREQILVGDNPLANVARKRAQILAAKRGGDEHVGSLIYGALTDAVGEGKGKYDPEKAEGGSPLAYLTQLMRTVGLRTANKQVSGESSLRGKPYNLTSTQARQLDQLLSGSLSLDEVTDPHVRGIHERRTNPNTPGAAAVPLREGSRYFASGDRITKLGGELKRTIHSDAIKEDSDGFISDSARRTSGVESRNLTDASLSEGAAKISSLPIEQLRERLGGHQGLIKTAQGLSDDDPMKAALLARVPEMKSFQNKKKNSSKSLRSGGLSEASTIPEPDDVPEGHSKKPKSDSPRVPPKKAKFELNSSSLDEALAKLQSIGLDIGSLNATPQIVDKIVNKKGVSGRGAYNIAGGLRLSRSSIKDPEQLMKTLSHELGHAIDAKSGSFASTDTASSYYQIAAKYLKDNAEETAKLSKRFGKGYAEDSKEGFARAFSQQVMSILSGKAKPEDLKQFLSPTYQPSTPESTGAAQTQVPPQLAARVAEKKPRTSRRTAAAASGGAGGGAPPIIVSGGGGAPEPPDDNERYQAWLQSRLMFSGSGKPPEIYGPPRPEIYGPPRPPEIYGPPRPPNTRPKGRFEKFIGSRRAANLGIGAAIALPIAASYISDFGGSAESAAIGGSGGFTTARGVSGAISGGLAGAYLGAQAGPYGAAAGAIIGATAGIVYALNGAAKEIQDVKIDNALVDVRDSLGRVASVAGALQSTDINELKVKLGDFKSLSSERDRNAATHFFGGFSREDFEAKQISSTRQQLGSNLPQFTAALANQAEQIGRANSAVAKSMDELSKELFTGNDGLNRELVKQVSIIRGVSIASVLKELEKNIKAGADAERFKFDAKRAGQAESETITAFGKLSLSFDSAAESIKTFRSQLELTSDLFHGNIGSSRVNINAERFGQFGRNDEGLTGTLRTIRAVGGEQGEGLFRVGSVLDKVANKLPGILSGAVGRGVDAGSIAETVRTELTKSLGYEPGRTPKEVNQVITQLVNQINSNLGGDNEKLNNGIALDATAFADQLLAPLAGPMKESGQRIAKQLEDSANQFSDNLSHLARMMQETAELRFQGATSRLTARTVSEGFAAYNRGENHSVGLNSISLRELENPQNSRLAGLLGSANLRGSSSPSEISGVLRDLNGRRIPEVERVLQSEFAKDPSSQATANAATELTNLKTQSSNLVLALKQLSNGAQQAAAAQQKLSSLENERSNRLGVGESFYSAGVEERQNFARGASLVRRAHESGSLDGFSASQQQLIIQTLNKFGSTTLKGLRDGQGNALTANAVKNRLLQNSGGGVFDLDATQKSEMGALQATIVQHFNAATEANEGLVQNQEALSVTFFTQLTQAHENFFARLAGELTKDEAVAQQNQLGREQASLPELRAGVDKANTLRRFGVNTEKVNPDTVVAAQGAQAAQAAVEDADARTKMAQDSVDKLDFSGVKVTGKKVGWGPFKFKTGFTHNVDSLAEQLENDPTNGLTKEERKRILGYAQDNFLITNDEDDYKEQLKKGIEETLKNRKGDYGKKLEDRDRHFRALQSNGINLDKGIDSSGIGELGGALDYFSKRGDKSLDAPQAELNEARRRIEALSASQQPDSMPFLPAKVNRPLNVVGGVGSQFTLNRPAQEQIGQIGQVAVATAPAQLGVNHSGLAQAAFNNIGAAARLQDPFAAFGAGRPGFADTGRFYGAAAQSRFNLYERKAASDSNYQTYLNGQFKDRYGVGVAGAPLPQAPQKSGPVGFFSVPPEQIGNQAGKSSTAVQKEVSNLTTGFATFGKTVELLSDSFVRFENSAKALSESLAAFPDTLKIEGNMETIVHMPGAEAFTKLEPVVKEWIDEMVSQRIASTMRDYFPDAAPPL